MFSDNIRNLGCIGAFTVNIYSPTVAPPRSIEIDTIAVIVVTIHCVIKMIPCIFVITFSIKDISTSSLCHNK